MIRDVWHGFLHSFMQDLLWELVGSGVALDRGFVEYVLVELLKEENNILINNTNVAEALEGAATRLSGVSNPQQVRDGWPCNGPLVFARVIVQALGENLRTPAGGEQAARFVCAFVNALIARGEVLNVASRLRHGTRMMDPSRDLAQVYNFPRRSS